MTLMLVIAGCSETAPEPVEQSIAEACGISDLRFVIDEEKQEFVLLEMEIEGTMRNEAGDVFSAPMSNREMLVAQAMPCLATEAERKGLRLNTSRRPMLHVDH